MLNNIQEKLDFDNMINSANPSMLPIIIHTISAIDDPLVREGYIANIVKKFKISKKMIMQLLQVPSSNQQESSGTKPTVTANIHGLIDIASDVQGSIVLLMASCLTSELEQFSSWNDGVTEYVPPAAKQLPYTPPRVQAVLQYHGNPDKSLMIDLISYLNRFCFISEGQALIVANMVFATYIQDHDDVNYIPIISLVGEPERGKSRLGMAATFASYRGVALNGIREAHIIRLAEDYSATIFIDLRAAWKKVVGEKCEDLILGRYEKGHQIMRVISPEKGAFSDSRYFKAYGPTFIASNEPLDSVLETRCIPLVMENHPAEYEKPAECFGLEFRERLTAWRAKTLISPLPTIEPVLGLHGRYWDISSTLLRICALVHPEGYETLKTELLRIAIDKMEKRKTSWEGIIVQQLLSLTGTSVAGTPNGLIKLNDLLQILNKMLPNNRQLSSQRLGLKLNNMGLKTKHIQGHSHIIIDIQKLDTLRQQFGFDLSEGTVK
jgi:hypothetical protein